jgi:hypothetical protein
MLNTSAPSAAQSPSKIVIEIPTSGVRAAIFFKPAAKAASAPARKANGQFAATLASVEHPTSGPFSQAAE